jgi:hypothetical protein
LAEQLLDVGRARNLHGGQRVTPPGEVLKPLGDVFVGETARAVSRAHAERQLAALTRRELHQAVETLPSRVPRGAGGGHRALERKLAVGVSESDAIGTCLGADRSRLLATSGLRLLDVGEIGVEYPRDGERNALGRPVRQGQFDVDAVEARAVPQADVDRPLGDAVGVSPRRVVRHVRATAAKLRELGIDVDEFELVVRRRAVRAQPGARPVDLQGEHAEVARLAEVVAAQRVALPALSALIRDEE